MKWKHEKLIQFNASHVPKWSKHFFSYRKTLRIEIVDLAYSMARNYAIFEICIFQMDTFFSRSFSTMKINREIDEPKQFLRLVAQRHFKHNSVEERHVSVAKNQFESLSIELYAHTHTHVLSHYSIMWGVAFSPVCFLGWRPICPFLVQKKQCISNICHRWTHTFEEPFGIV